MASSFFERIDHLSDAVGHGDITMRVKVDQVYAKYQELRDDLHHPDGGKAHYLRDSLYEGNAGRMTKIAERTITVEGSALKDAIIDAAENLSDDVFVNAPLEFGDLRASGNPSVTDNGAEVYNRPPNVHRLSKAELRAKSRVRSLFRFERGF